MEKPYYAILIRHKNIEQLDDDNISGPIVVFQSLSYSESYKEYQTLLQTFPAVKQLACEDFAVDNGTEVNNDIAGELCIVRISPMTDWVDPETSN